MNGFRAFFAIPLPQASRDELVHAASSTIPPNMRDRLRGIPKANFHITLVFLSTISEQCGHELVKQLREPLSNQPQFTISLNAIGPFPSHRPHLVVAFIATNPMLEKLQTTVMEVCMARDELEFENRAAGFIPHITVARAGNTRLSALPTKPIDISFPVGQVHLYRSTLSHSGSVYSVVETLPLGHVL